MSGFDEAAKELKLEDAYTSREAADKIGCPLTSLPHYINDGRLTAYMRDNETGKLILKEGPSQGKRLYFPRVQVDKFEYRLDQVGQSKTRTYNPENTRSVYHHEYYVTKLKEKRRRRQKSETANEATSGK
ncbi:hypothetical protein KSD_70380 [Ktedonobacter sp. SOSP1-85]|uniref:hypothetical protein n=1 Tax=Ktedonobacter sp. SOSP1-85 TaxID=2778367 RepID=UPI0019154841|nr:hypothetical protein [Ktedonobacter sp. SOSP1-85]GHO79267.1 hypothetical protein KSD_70380 [Ktedonobacter sp. SOSP1-85]